MLETEQILDNSDLNIKSGRNKSPGGHYRGDSHPWWNGDDL